MYGTGVALAVHKQRVRLYCFVCALLAFDAVLRDHNFSLICHFAVNNGNDGSLLILVPCTYGTVVVLSLDEQAVRLH